MSFRVVTRIALKNLRRTSLRSALTTLGIVAGAAAIVVVLSIGAGARAYVESTLADMESNQLQITGDPKSDRWRSAQSLPPGDGLTIADYQAIQRDIGGVESATVRTYSSLGRFASATERARLIVHGMDSGAFQVFGRHITAGNAFSASDVRNRARVCVITESISRALFGDANPLGARVTIADNSFVVVGVMEDDPRHRLKFPNDPGDFIAYMPYTTYLQRVDRSSGMAIILRARDPAELGQMQEDVSNLLESRRGTRVAQFNTGNVAEAVERQIDASRTLTLLLGSIGAVSLFVGGLGVMNVMLMSVTERTREIGLRIALGTRAQEVMRLFLIEAMALSLCGGILGTMLGFLGTWFAAHLSGWPVRITPGTVYFSLLCVAAIGVGFGYFPAQRAAALDPIRALRAE